MKDCKSCKSYKECNGKEFYSYSDIRWCPLQCLWIIEYLSVLKRGEWPDTPPDEIKEGRQLVRQGYFLKHCEIASELEYRLKRTGTDGKLLIAQVREGVSYKLLGYEVRRKFAPEAYTALMYIKGWRRKRDSYADWKKKRKYDLSVRIGKK